ncbi:DUF6542 domain-containing protein [Microbispora sp. NPDC049125]|uniref:DUF6542 domain-containing protein n=1 Tax=Microbispora sp. NPDC049125 TaxID=3154929 RepID=UPI003465C097
MAGTDRAGVRLTARGAIVMLFTATLVGRLLPLPVSGLVFVAGCLAAVLLVHPRDLLPLVVTPPLVFFVATTLVELARSIGAGSPLQALGLGLFTALSSGAPWLFGGSALALAAAWPRGLPGNVRALRADAGPDPAGPPAPRGRGRRGASFDPEPEGYFEPRVYGKAAEK